MGTEFSYHQRPQSPEWCQNYDTVFRTKSSTPKTTDDPRIKIIQAAVCETCGAILSRYDAYMPLSLFTQLKHGDALEIPHAKTPLCRHCLHEEIKHPF